MKKFFLLRYFGLFVIIAFCGCAKDGWFDVKYDKKVGVPTTVTELQAILDNGEVFNMYCPMAMETAADDHYLEEDQAMQLSGFERNSYIWIKDAPNIKVSDWIDLTRGSYRKVFAANLVIEGIEKISPRDESERIKCKNVKGQALFFRAQAFYWLAQIFVPPYDEATFDKKLGIPLRLNSNVDEISIRSSVKETYAQIEKDLLDAVSLLPLIQNYKTRPSRSAAYAMLAKVYLTNRDYINANKMANLALAGQDVLLDFSDLNFGPFSNPFEVYNKEIIFHSTMGGNAIFTFFNVRVKKEVYDMYQDGDLRKKAFFDYDIGTGTVTYKGTYAGSGYFSFFNGLACDELYLIRAECNVRTGNLSLALNDLNKLLRTRWDDSFNEIVVDDPEEALRIIINERRKELIFRGVRWSDLRRLNMDPRFASTLTRSLSGKTYTLEPNSYKYTLPIPDDIIQITGMEQNPGWE
ncbi:RagB/SusD family nutrient uptake outer membrane protein [Chitinophaga deserti]|uniref:RagB/SusD family nutrient uptake outer membrane protein n=1 Tax=Chitinophaga deserti TaxID=2164099 RepID=UPI0018E4EF52|nr:RagB/SusD family nutrient uptake outer membrane protein [Chitinophaga deserti]